MKKLLSLLMIMLLLVGCSGGNNGGGGDAAPADGGSDAATVVTLQAPTPLISMDPVVVTDGASPVWCLWMPTASRFRMQRNPLRFPMTAHSTPSNFVTVQSGQTAIRSQPTTSSMPGTECVLKNLQQTMPSFGISVLLNPTKQLMI